MLLLWWLANLTNLNSTCPSRFSYELVILLLVLEFNPQDIKCNGMKDEKCQKKKFHLTRKVLVSFLKVKQQTRKIRTRLKDIEGD